MPAKVKRNQKPAADTIALAPIGAKGNRTNHYILGLAWRKLFSDFSGAAVPRHWGAAPALYTTNFSSIWAKGAISFAMASYPSRPIRAKVAFLPSSTAGWSYGLMFSSSPARLVVNS